MNFHAIITLFHIDLEIEIMQKNEAISKNASNIDTFIKIAQMVHPFIETII